MCQAKGLQVDYTEIYLSFLYLLYIETAIGFHLLSTSSKFN